MTVEYFLGDHLGSTSITADSTGAKVSEMRYKPWGDTLDTYGTGNFSFGYLGGVLDATTGLLYVGNGQYYDPATGRFLTRNVNLNSTNPYTPWNPIGAVVGPLGLLSLFYSRKKKGGKGGMFLVLLLVIMTVGMTLSACGPAPTPAPGPTIPPGAPTEPSPNQTPQPIPSPTAPTTPLWLDLNCADVTSNWGFGSNENLFNNLILDAAELLRYHRGYSKV